MVNKTLRIMIASEQHGQRLNIERHLNHLGYYRIAPVRSAEEVFLLTHPPVDHFDLLIITDSMCAAVELDLIDSQFGALRVRNILIV